MKTALAAFLALCLSAPLAAQSRAPAPAADDEPSFALRPFFVLTGEKVAAKQTWKNVILSWNTTRHLQKWKPLFSKAKRPNAGGCNSPIKNSSHALIKIIYWQAAMKYRKGGCARRKEFEGLIGPPISEIRE